ncbi:hypothetical protein BDK51DRAFT_46817 [Blyttiomyces helicus]|uniref:Uncharacterized protein n=1 Tax=Blyttiomyces helicus TaxID=388810 RepID=A0A4P9WLA8_9FUNG|nr:hypothetical protein BDK51DRAFT_46817 [Blyttiomyces helicus]|eukprot:RKO93182.1 hypothetical protein BDK51DRAFT_46817 [Blyttiomyces helicus]
MVFTQLGKKTEEVVRERRSIGSEYMWMENEKQSKIPGHNQCKPPPPLRTPLAGPTSLLTHTAPNMLPNLLHLRPLQIPYHLLQTSNTSSDPQESTSSREWRRQGTQPRHACGVRAERPRGTRRGPQRLGARGDRTRKGLGESGRKPGRYNPELAWLPVYKSGARSIAQSETLSEPAFLRADDSTASLPFYPTTPDPQHTHFL